MLSHRKKTLVLVDVGSGSAAVAIVQIDPAAGTEPVIAASERIHLPISERTPSQTIPGLSQALKDAAARALKKYTSLDKRLFMPPTELYIFVHAPWAASRNVPIYRNLGKEVQITDAMISDLAKESLSAEIAKTKDRRLLLEATVVRILINGYATRTPHGKRGFEVRLDTLISECDQEFKAAIASAVQAQFPALKPQWRTHTRAVICALNERVENPKNCVVLDISSESTTMLVIRKARLEAQETIDGGTRAMLNAISGGSMPEEVLAMLKLIERDDCATDACRRVASLLATEESDMIRAYGEVFTHLSLKRRLPHHMYVLTRSELAPWFVRFFSRLDFAQFTVTSMPFAVGQVNADRRSSSSSDVVIDTAMWLGALLVNSELRDE